MAYYVRLFSSSWAEEIEFMCIDRHSIYTGRNCCREIILEHLVVDFSWGRQGHVMVGGFNCYQGWLSFDLVFRWLSIKSHANLLSTWRVQLYLFLINYWEIEDGKDEAHFRGTFQHVKYWLLLIEYKYVVTYEGKLLFHSFSLNQRPGLNCLCRIDAMSKYNSMVSRDQ